MGLYKNLGKRLTSLILAVIIATTSSTYTGTRKLTKKELDSYQKYFKEFNLDSEYDKYEDIKYKVDELMQTGLSLNECPYEYEGTIELLVSKIKLNTMKYIQDYSDIYYPFKTNLKNIKYEGDYTKENLERYQEVFEKVIYSALEKLITSAGNNINEDICKIQDLKIVFADTKFGLYGIYEPEENLIIISANQVIGYTEKIFEEDITAQQKRLEEVFSHELNHLRQHTCKHRIVSSTKPFCLNYSAPIVSTIVESSVESYHYNLGIDENYLTKETYDYSYPTERSQEGLLFLLSLFNGKELKEYYNSIMDTDIDKFNKFFGARTVEEIYDLYRIIYYIDVYNERMPSLPLDNQEIAKQELKNLYKLEIYKKVLSNMANYTNSTGTISLEENLIILNIIKDIILNNEYEEKQYYEEETQKSISEYEENFSKLSNKYNEFLCTYYGISPKKLKESNLKATEITNGLNNILSNNQEKLSKILESYPILKSVLYTYSYYINKDIKEELEQEYPTNLEIPLIIRELKQLEIEPKKLIRKESNYKEYYKNKTRII